MTVVPKTGVTSLTFLTQKIRTAVSNYVTQLNVGASLSQSAIVSIVQSIPDVSWVVVPFNRMVKADGSFIARDNVGRTQWQVFNPGAVNSFITSAVVLSYNTTDKGGPENLFRGVFENEHSLVLQSNELDVSGGAGRAYIRSDGKIVVSTKDGQIPDDKDYKVAYWVYGETGSKDINVASLEYLTVGNFMVIYDQSNTQPKTL
jgi:hypothetical protein